MKHQIELGVSLYSFTDLYLYEKNTIEELIRAVSEMDVEKMEIVGSQMIRNYPYLKEEDVDELLGYCKKYGVHFHSYGANLDVGKYSDHDMTDDEILRESKHNLQIAHLLGCEVMREGLSPALLVKMAPFAERYGIQIGVEIHAPVKPSSKIVKDYIDAIQSSGSDMIGLIVDFGCFIERPSPALLKSYADLGADPKIVDYIIKVRHSGRSEEEVWQEIQKMGAGKIEHKVLSELFGFLSFAPADLDGFSEMVPYCNHFHGKFYYVDESQNEVSIPYEPLLRIIAESGFKGCIVSEYEGHAFSDEDPILQVQRHLRMERNILETLK